jgi:hypothetical protein
MPQQLGYLDAEENTTKIVYVKGLYDKLNKAYNENKILDERVKKIDITDYNKFGNVK